VIVLAALSTGTIAALVVLFVLNLFAIVFGLSFLRRGRSVRAAQAAPAPARPAPALTRRDFFRGSLLVSLVAFGAEFGLGTLAFLWPNLRGGFGAVISAGSITDIKAEIQDTGQPVYVGIGRFYVVPYTGTPTEDANYAEEGVSTQGLMALYQRCVHLGCRVPFCDSSKWFECPCHGSKYNEAGEYKLGPAPRGMDRFVVAVAGDELTVDTSKPILGPPRGTDTINENPQGPFCVAPG
jgi:cytochrome b6-f complex iron-sulfur subunit